MEKKIKLIMSLGRLSDREPFIIADNEALTLTFESEYPLSDLIISLKNGDMVKQYKCSGNSFTVPKDTCKSGELIVTVSLLKKGEVIKVWNIAPIIIKEVPAGFEAYEAIHAIVKRLNELTERVNFHAIDISNEAGYILGNRPTESASEIHDIQSWLNGTYAEQCRYIALCERLNINHGINQIELDNEALTRINRLRHLQGLSLLIKNNIL